LGLRGIAEKFWEVMRHAMRIEISLMNFIWGPSPKFFEPTLFPTTQFRVLLWKSWAQCNELSLI